jgi:hypothetical protein
MEAKGRGLKASSKEMGADGKCWLSRPQEKGAAPMMWKTAPLDWSLALLAWPSWIIDLTTSE